MTIIRTLQGDVPPEDLGLTLMHEHLVVDVRLPQERPSDGYEEDLESIIAPMLGHLRRVRETGVRTIVDCTPTNVGQYREAYLAVAERTGLTVVSAVGTYRDAWLPEWVRSASPEELADWFERGLAEGAGFIKLGCDPDGPSEAEALCARSARRREPKDGLPRRVSRRDGRSGEQGARCVRAGRQRSGALRVVHLQNEPDAEAHLALARRGAWVEYDAIGAYPADEEYIHWLRALADAGLLDRTLVSQDACAYIVLDGGVVERQHRFDYMLAAFVPAMLEAGFTQQNVQQLLVANPARALAFEPS
ncbi:MAG: hypothetical protein WKH64_13525 [Chloroflexia bacterium]